ncbi:DNA/RNA nuclease SfsA [Crassaminicella indica]|uniref:DNA/RNA nuclease SfsA n=1 Tax=Crassaminicella indica TaxID=2855394 RepID=A0ABX8RE04_9CLOT|nr:DNA/RNA nuclease SfsA [Crassaminicella indica]QXM06624.1 DNA/RNA nuclease SfsA [Crassaminicella indica]
MKISSKIIEGKFLYESKNRFICKVLINNEEIECYVPSASRLENYLILKNKKVLLTLNKGKKRRTKYSLFAVEYYGKYIMLNLNIVNNLVEEYIIEKIDEHSCENLYKEKFVNGYKADFLLEGKEKVVVEAKGIISARRDVVFPSVFSQRAIDQLRALLELLKSGYKVYYFYISLSPIVKSITINSFDEKYSKLLKKCMKKEMKIKAFSSCYSNNEVKLYKEIEINA